MTKTFRSLVSVLLAVFMVVSLAVIPSSAAIAISHSAITLTNGYQTTLSVTGTSSTVTWSTGDKSIATVNTKGTVVGKAPGTTYVYAKVGGTTLKCKVTVVAAKITSSTSSVTFDKKGQTKTITVQVKGSHSGLTVGTTNKNVASASWVKPVKWDGDKITYTITAQGTGTARIKVYLKNYPDTCYNFVDVKVGSTSSSSGSNSNSSSSSSKMTILTNPRDSVSVASGSSTTLQVYSTNQANLAYSISDSSVASVSAGAASGYYRDLTIRGIKDGTATLKLYDKNNTSTYCNVQITVSSSSYYEFYTTMPTKVLATDKIMTIQASTTSSYYMLVPENYDPAYVNTLIARKFGRYSYYEVYSSTPIRQEASDQYYEFYNSNSNYSYGARYVLVPEKYDEVRLNTAIARYTGKFDYWTVYSDNPTRLSPNDILETWLIVEPYTNKSASRYMLIPAGGYDADKVDSIKSSDMSQYGSYGYYVGYTKWPTVYNNIDQIIMYRKDNTYKYMVVPKDGSGMAKANDAIAKDTGIYEYNVIYSTQPVASNTEKVVSVQYGKNFYYVLIKAEDKSPDTDLANRYANGVKDD